MRIRRALLAVGAAALAAFSLAACQTELAITFDGDAAPTKATGEIQMPKSLVAMGGINTLDDLKAEMEKDSDPLPEGATVEYSEDANNFIVSIAVSPVTEETMLEMMPFAEDTPWTFDGEATAGTVSVTFLRELPEAKDDVIDLDGDFPQPRYFVTLAFPGKVQEVAVNGADTSEDATVSEDGTSVRVEVTTATESIAVTADSSANAASGKTLNLVLALGGVVLIAGGVLAFMWFRRRDNREPGSGVDADSDVAEDWDSEPQP